MIFKIKPDNDQNKRYVPLIPKAIGIKILSALSNCVTPAVTK